MRRKKATISFWRLGSLSKPCCRGCQHRPLDRSPARATAAETARGDGGRSVPIRAEAPELRRGLATLLQIRNAQLDVAPAIRAPPTRACLAWRAPIGSHRRMRTTLIMACAIVVFAA